MLRVRICSSWALFQRCFAIGKLRKFWHSRVIAVCEIECQREEGEEGEGEKGDGEEVTRKETGKEKREEEKDREVMKV